MIFFKKLAMLVACFCFVFSATAIAAGPVPEISANQLAAKIAENKGKVVVVNIFASWCPPCRQEVPDLISVRKEFSEDQFVLMGVSIDEDTENGKNKESKALAVFLDEMKTNYPIYIGDDNFVGEIGINAVPHLYVYDKKGALHLNHRGFITKNELTAVLKKLLAE